MHNDVRTARHLASALRPSHLSAAPWPGDIVCRSARDVRGRRRHGGDGGDHPADRQPSLGETDERHARAGPIGLLVSVTATRGADTDRAGRDAVPGDLSAEAGSQDTAVGGARVTESAAQVVRCRSAGRLTLQSWEPHSAAEHGKSTIGTTTVSGACLIVPGLFQNPTT